MGEVVAVVGPNATGKTPFVKMLAGQETPTSGAVEGRWQVSYKPQYLEAVYEGTVGDLLRNAVGKKADTGYFETEILQPLKVKGMLERDVSTLSGGELQRVAIASRSPRASIITRSRTPFTQRDVSYDEAWISRPCPSEMTSPSSTIVSPRR